MNAGNNHKEPASVISKIGMLCLAVVIVVVFIAIRSRVQKAAPPEPVPPVTTNMPVSVVTTGDHSRVRDHVNEDMTTDTQPATDPVAAGEPAKGREERERPELPGSVQARVDGDKTTDTPPATNAVAAGEPAGSGEDRERSEFLVRLDSVRDGTQNAQSMLRGSASEQLVEAALDRLESDLLSQTNAPQLRERPEMRQKWLNAISNYRGARGMLSWTNKPNHKEICAYGLDYVAREVREVRAALEPNQ